jgi:hypothetical protein
MGEQGSMIVNGKKVDGRTLSFGDEGVKVGNGEEEKVVVPNEFDFAEVPEATESDFADVDESYAGHNSLLYDLNRKEINKKIMIGAGIAVGVVAGLIIGGVIYKKKG